MSPSSSGKKKTAGATADENPSADVTDKGCVHHWVVEPPYGSLRQGHCKACGESKEFRNSFEYSSWYGNKSPGPKNGVSDTEDTQKKSLGSPRATQRTVHDTREAQRTVHQQTKTNNY